MKTKASQISQNKIFRWIKITAGVLIFLLVVYFALEDMEILSGFSKVQNISYPEFYSQVEENNVSAASITKKHIMYTLNGSSQKYKTDNPENENLKEFLLLHGVSVTIKKESTEVASLIFDIIFYSVFILIFGTVFVKFISPNTFKTVRKTGVKFDDIVGMDDLKKDMKQLVDVMQHPGEYAKRGIRMPKGILLEGAPGNGKTLFARAIAGEAKVNFIPAKATDFESMFMAIGPMKVKLLFRKARRCAPCIVFIDEFDGIGTKRNYSGSAIETENTRIVTALLNELDGFTPNNGIVVIAATNSRESLDPALIRSGRFDAKYKVPYPGEHDRVELVKMYAGNKKCSLDCNPETLAKKFDGLSCAQIESVINRAALIAQQKGQEEFTMNEIQLALTEL